MAILPFLTLFLTALKGFVYTISVDIYAFRLTFSGILHRILHHFGLRLAPKWLAFSSKMHYI